MYMYVFLSLSLSLSLSGTSFQRLIPDTSNFGSDSVKRHIFCSGKIYYELAKQREINKMENDVAITRIEQVSLTCTHTQVGARGGQLGISLKI